MKWIALGLMVAAGWSIWIAARAVQRRRVSPRWLNENTRREWASGVDGPYVDWDAMKERDA